MRKIELAILFVAFISCTAKEKKSAEQQLENIEIKQSEVLSDTNKQDLQFKEDRFKLDFLPVDNTIPMDITQETFNKQIKEKLPAWIKYYITQSPDFSIDSFKNLNTSILQPYQVSLEDKESQNRFFDLYNPFLIWSPDSTKAIDLYSYSHILDYDSLGIVYGMMDIDCQIALLDIINQKRIVLSTFGPAVELQDAFWLNNDTIIVASIEYDIDEIFIPYYSMIDLTTFLVRYYEQEKKLKLKDNGNLESVFEGIEFE